MLLLPAGAEMLLPMPPGFAAAVAKWLLVLTGADG